MRAKLLIRGIVCFAILSFYFLFSPITVNAAEPNIGDFDALAVSFVDSYFDAGTYEVNVEEIRNIKLYEIYKTFDFVWIANPFMNLPKPSDSEEPVMIKAKNLSNTVKQNRPLILDMDMSSDADDLSAFGLACALDKMDVFDIKGVMMSVRGEDDRNLAAANGFLKSEGLTGVLIGRSETEFMEDSAYWNYMNGEGDSWTNVDMACRQYRRILASAEDNSVEILTTGYLGNLRALMQSTPDDISEFSGKQLVASKVRRLFVVGGAVPSGMDNNFIVADAPADASYVAENFWCPTIFITNDLGSKMNCGRYLMKFDPDNKSAVSRGLRQFGATDGYIAWDPFGVYVCAFCDNPFISQIALIPTTITINPQSGENFFVDSADGVHQRVKLLNFDMNYYSSIMDSVLIHDTFFR